MVVDTSRSKPTPSSSSIAFKRTGPRALGWLGAAALVASTAVLPATSHAQVTDEPYAIVAGTNSPYVRSPGSPVWTAAGNSQPFLVDFGGGPELDILVGTGDGTVRFFENTGDTQNPTFGFSNRIVVDDGSGGTELLDVGDDAAPVAVDLDDDGDLDLVVGANDGSIHYFEYDESLFPDEYVEQTGAANPFDGVSSSYPATPALADFDGDGDLDMIMGNKGTLRYFENTGTASSPGFTERTGTDNPFDGFTGNNILSPTIEDTDNDGDYDVIAGQGSDGGIRYFENTGDPSPPTFTEQTGASNPFADVDAGTNNAPALGDLDGDGRFELATGSASGRVHYFDGTDGQALMTLTPQTGASNPFDGENVGDESVPALADVDGDGDLDAAIGEETGTLKYYQNDGDAQNPSFVAQTGASNPFDGFDISSSDLDDSAPAFGDLDNDGDPDVAVGRSFGDMAYLENTGTAQSPLFTRQTGSGNPFDGLAIDYPSNRPALADLDADGDLDLAVADSSGSTFSNNEPDFFENTGSAGSPAFTKRTGTANPLANLSFGQYDAFSFGDVDADGDLDIVVGVRTGFFQYFENTGDAQNPAFTERISESPMANLRTPDQRSTPALADLDNDGDLDVVAGSEDGSLSYFQNSGFTVPVELTRFTAQRDGQAALLAWETASETDNAGFEVHRMLGGGMFDLLGFVEGAGTTTTPQSYRFRAADLGVGTHRFRLKQIDYDGDAEYSPTVEIEIGIDGQYTIVSPYPNPTRNTAQLEIAVPEPQHVDVVVYDALGRHVQTLLSRELAPNRPARFRMGRALASGTYVIRITGASFRTTRKLTIVR